MILRPAKPGYLLKVHCTLEQVMTSSNAHHELTTDFASKSLTTVSENDRTRWQGLLNISREIPCSSPHVQIWRRLYNASRKSSGSISSLPSPRLKYLDINTANQQRDVPSNSKASRRQHRLAVNTSSKEVVQGRTNVRQVCRLRQIISHISWGKGSEDKIFKTISYLCKNDQGDMRSAYPNSIYLTNSIDKIIRHFIKPLPYPLFVICMSN